VVGLKRGRCCTEDDFLLFVPNVYLPSSYLQDFGQKTLRWPIDGNMAAYY
jgi:hypothetical protein